MNNPPQDLCLPLHPNSHCASPLPPQASPDVDGTPASVVAAAARAAITSASKQGRPL